MAGDERGFVRRDEDDRVRDLLRAAEAIHRDSRHQRRFVLRRAGEAGQHAGIDRAGRHGVHADPRFDDLERHRLGDAFDSMLAADIDGGARGALVAVGRGDVDDAAAALFLHDAHFVLHAQEHAENVGVEGRGVAFRGLVGDRARLTLGAGVVHRDIETAKPADGLVDQSANLILLAYVGVDELRLGAEGMQLRDERLAGLVTPTGNDDLCALLRKSDSGGATDACEGSRDQNDLLAHWILLGVEWYRQAFDGESLYGSAGYRRS